MLVLSPVSLQQVSAELTLETRTAAATAGNTAEGVLQTEDYNAAASAAEATLLDAEWRPVSQAVLARAATDPAVRESLAVLRAQGTNSLLQSALVVARAANVSNIFLIRAVTLRTDPTPLVHGGYQTQRARGYQATVDAVLVRASDGEVLWAGAATGRSTDVLTAPLQLSPHISTLERSDLGGSPALQDTVCDEPCAQRPRGVVTLVQIAVRRLGVEFARRGNESGSAPAAATDAGACQGGRRITADTAGNCCWEGQVWSNLRTRCVGVPTCPAGARVQGEDCAL